MNAWSTAESVIKKRVEALVKESVEAELRGDLKTAGILYIQAQALGSILGELYEAFQGGRK